MGYPAHHVLRHPLYYRLSFFCSSVFSACLQSPHWRICYLRDSPSKPFRQLSQQHSIPTCIPVPPTNTYNITVTYINYCPVSLLPVTSAFTPLYSVVHGRAVLPPRASPSFPSVMLCHFSHIVVHSTRPDGLHNILCTNP